MTPKEKALLLAIATGAPEADCIPPHDRARIMTAATLEDKGYLTIQEAKGLYGLTIAKCKITPDGAQWLVSSEFRHLLPKEFMESHGASMTSNYTGKND